MTITSFVEIIEHHYQAHQNPQRAKEMSAYMRNLFPYLGINRPQRDEINKLLFPLVKQYVNTSFLEEVATLLFQKQEREYHYFALDLLLKYIHHLDENSIHTIEKLALQYSWWDSIDFFATKIVSKLLAKYPALWEKIDEWSVSDELWLRRIAIICQIPFKKKTNEKRLFQYCLYNAQDKDFFIRKAIGWALREYTKTNAVAVIDFVNKYEELFSPLSKKEALRRLK
jgi:3-methyladenine DNA glycosylase AlkD